MTFLSGFGEKFALSLTLDLVKASAAVVRRRLGKSDAETALRAAIAQALDEVGASIDVPADLSGHYKDLLEDFFRREEVVAELAQLLDPRPDVELDFAALTRQFEAEHDSASLEHLDLAAFLRAFASAFYAAAASQPELQSNLEMKLLGEMVKRTGLTVQATERTAAATEQMTGLLQKYLEDQNGKDALLLAAHTARDQGMLAAFQAFEGIAAGMFKAGFDFGVGRTGLIEIGGDLKALPPAQADTIRTLAADLRQTVLDATPGPAELDALEQRYRQHVIRWFENLQFQGLMRTPRPIVLPLEDVYVELRAVAEVPDAADAFSVEERRLLLEVDEQNPDGRREMMSQLDALRRERWSRTLPERKSIAESLHQRDCRAFVILGDPGSGKTTLLHFLALVYARGPQTAAERLKIDPPEADRLPIFVPLAAFDDMLRESRRAGGSLTLLEFLPRYYDRRRGLPGLEPLFRRALTSGRAVVLLDGLDEVIDVGTRTYVAEQAGALINEWSPRGVRFAVSSRFVGYREAPVSGNLPTLSVLDFGLPEIEIFVHRWAEAYEKWAANGESPEMFRRARTLETDLLTDVKSNDSVRRLAANPLMITMLALLRRQVGRLPHRRVQLYESYVGALLENWVDARSQGAREQSVEILDRHQAENLLIPLALWLQQEKPSGTAGRAEIQQKLTEICLEEAGLTGKATRPQIREAEDKALRFLQEMRQMTGLLIERGHDAFGFLHLTFQEYFAGRALARLSDEERHATIRPNRHDPRWREPILLCAGRLGVVENRRAQVTEFVRGILDCPDDTEEKLHRNLLLALAIAGDDVNLEPGLVNEMVGRAVAYLPIWVKTLVRNLMEALGQLVANGAAGVEECFGKAMASRNWWQRGGTVGALARFAGVDGIRELLLERLEDSNSEVVIAALEALSSQVGLDEGVRQKVLEKLVDERFQVRNAAVRALAGIAGTDHTVRRAILERLEDDAAYVQKAAARVLSGILSLTEDVRLVLSKLDDPNHSVRAAGVGALSGTVRSDEKVRRALLSKLNDSAAEVRQAAVIALSGAVALDEEIRRAVLSKIEDPYLFVREIAIRALAGAVVTDRGTRRLLLVKLMHLPESEKVAIMRILSGFLTSDDEVSTALRAQSTSIAWSVRQCLAEELGEHTASQENLATLCEFFEDRNASEALGLLRGMSLSPDLHRLARNEKWRSWWLSRMALGAYMRGSAITVLGSLIGEDKEVRRAVLGGLGDERPGVRISALSSLSRVVGTDEEVRRAVLESLVDQDSYVRGAALSALASAVGTDGEVRRAVLENLVDQDSHVGWWVLQVLARVASTDVEARRAILERLTAKRHEVRQSALNASSSLVGTDEEIRRAVLERLEDERAEVRESALNVLSGVVGTDQEVRRAVLTSLGNEQPRVRHAALGALSGVVGTDQEVRRAVLTSLGNEQPWVRQAALGALSGVVGTDEEARRAVLERLADEDRDIRRSAVTSLASLFGKRLDTTQPIVELLSDADFSVRLATVEVITGGPSEALDATLVVRLRGWLMVDSLLYDSSVRRVRAQLAGLFGSRISSDPLLKDWLFGNLRDPRWSARLGAVLTLLNDPDGPADEVLDRVFEALEDRRGLEAYPAQLAAASFLINRDKYSKNSIALCLEALDYGTQAWEDPPRRSDVRQQAALVLGKLEPLFFDERAYDKLLKVMENDRDFSIKDAAYGALVRLARVREQVGALRQIIDAGGRTIVSQPESMDS